MTALTRSQWTASLKRQAEISVSGRNGSFSDLTSGGKILNFTGMPYVLTRRAAQPCTSLLIAWIENVISILYSRCVIHSILRNVLSLNLNQSDFISRFPRSIKYGTVPPIAITWWEASAGGSVTLNVDLYLNKVVTEKCTLTTLILIHFPMML